MTKRYFFLLMIITSVSFQLKSQEDSLKIKKDLQDSLFILEIEDKVEGPPKVLHAEPLYIDLIRDLGARKGEKEWNVGLGLTDNNRFDEYEALVEYEWAPINRLGLEVEMPFSFYYPTSEDISKDSIPGSQLQSLKLAAQYSFLVKPEWNTSMAIGYLHEFEAVPFREYSTTQIYSGNLFNPFFVAAKRWGQNFHTLIYTGPQVFQEFGQSDWHTNVEINTSFHYMIDGTRNFIGIEVNKYLYHTGEFTTTLRPQMRVGVADNLLIGIVAGIPLNKNNERFSTFLRLIYEPGHRHK